MIEAGPFAKQSHMHARSTVFKAVILIATGWKPVLRMQSHAIAPHPSPPPEYRERE